MASKARTKKKPRQDRVDGEWTATREGVAATPVEPTPAKAPYVPEQVRSFGPEADEFKKADEAKRRAYGILLKAIEHDAEHLARSVREGRKRVCENAVLPEEDILATMLYRLLIDLDHVARICRDLQPKIVLAG